MLYSLGVDGKRAVEWSQEVEGLGIVKNFISEELESKLYQTVVSQPWNSVSNWSGNRYKVNTHTLFTFLTSIRSKAMAQSWI